MINPATFQTCIAGLVGFRPSLNTELPTIEDSLQESESGIYVNDIHSLISVENIYSCINETGLITLPTAWSGATAYTVGQKVSSSNIIYTSIQAGTNHAVTETAYWTRNGNALSVYLQDKINQSAVKIANQVYVNKNLNQQAKSIMPETMLYSGNGSIRDVIVPQGRFVGFRLHLKELDLGMQVRKIGIQFNEAITAFPIYLYNSNQLDPVKIWEINITQPFSFQWIELSKQVLSFLSDTTDASSDFYIGYYEDDLGTAKAINNKYTFTQNLCGACNPVNYNMRKAWGANIDITPFVVQPANFGEDRTLWDMNYIGFTDGINFGLNLLASVFCDTTDFFCRNKAGLANAIAYQTAVSIIQDMAYSVRDNQQQQKLMNMATFALGNQQNNTPGLEAQMAKQIMQVDFNYAGTNSKCLPCSDMYQNAVTLGSVF